MEASLFNAYLNGLEILISLVAVLIFVNGLDDLFVDTCYHTRNLIRYFRFHGKFSPLTLTRLDEIPESRIAILVPAWQEHRVIKQMLVNSCNTSQYQNFTIFAGVYANDPETYRAASTAASHFPAINVVVIPRNGPTNKADCLNCLYEYIQHYELETNSRFKIFALHDAEDVIHPYEFKLFNYLIPRKDMVQLPVLPLERRWNDFTAGHYLDEFAESHTKDLIVRESLLGHIPCAGVGCAFSRKAISNVASANNGSPFNTNSITEDYDFAVRMALSGHRQIFVRFGIIRDHEPIKGKPGWFLPRRKIEYVATREFFPAQLSASVRQKSRWLAGIALQGWTDIGWQGGLAMRYALLRDRKAILTAPAGILAWFTTLNLLYLWGIDAIAPGSGISRLSISGTVTVLLVLNGFILLNRAGHRAFYVYKFYDAKQACLSLPRQVWGNIINFLATGRAITIYVRSLILKQSITWEKTAHEFPSTAELFPFYRRLGDLLIDRGHITPSHLAQALHHQKSNGKLLGEILSETFSLDKQLLNEVLTEQKRLPLIAKDINDSGC